MNGFLLGLANGTLCLAYCAPVVVPDLLGEGRAIKGNYVILGKFLFGRLMGYLLFAILAWTLGLFLTKYQSYREMVFGVSYIVLALFLGYYCFRKPQNICAAGYFKGFIRKCQTFQPVDMYPVILGFFTGVNLCPPFLLAFTGAASTASLVSALAFFGSFFLGTLIFFVPLPLLGMWKQNQVAQWTGKMAAGLIGSYYFLVGMLMLFGGMKQ